MQQTKYRVRPSGPSDPTDEYGEPLPYMYLPARSVEEIQTLVNDLKHLYEICNILMYDSLPTDQSDWALIKKALVRIAARNLPTPEGKNEDARNALPLRKG